MSSFQKNNQICFEGKENKTWFVKKKNQICFHKRKKMKDFIKKISDLFLCKVKNK